MFEEEKDLKGFCFLLSTRGKKERRTDHTWEAVHFRIYGTACGVDSWLTCPRYPQPLLDTPIIIHKPRESIQHTPNHGIAVAHDAKILGEFSLRVLHLLGYPAPTILLPTRMRGSLLRVCKLWDELCVEYDTNVRSGHRRLSATTNLLPKAETGI